MAKISPIEIKKIENKSILQAGNSQSSNYNYQSIEQSNVDIETLNTNTDEEVSEFCNMLSIDKSEIKEIEEKGKTVANQAISEARSDKELMLKLREENIQQFVYDFAENLIDENQEFIGNDIAETAKAKIKRKKKEAEEGGKSDDVQQKKTRGRKAVAK